MSNFWNEFASSQSSCIETKTFNTAQNMLTNFDFTSPRLRILDAGCGSGIGTNHILTLVNSDAVVEAVDFSEEMVHIAQSRKIPGQVHFQTMDVSNLSFPDEQFDIYTSNMVLNVIDNQNGMIKEASRVLKKGSIACFSVWGRKENSLGIYLPRQCVDEILNKSRLINSNQNQRDIENAKLMHKQMVEKELNMFKDNKFEIITTQYNLIILETWNLDRYVEMSFKHPSQTKLKKDSPELFQKIKDLLKKRSNEEFKGDKFPTHEALVQVVRKINI